MKGITKLFLGLILLVILVGAIIQALKLFPNALNNEFDGFASRTLLLTLLLVASFAMLMFAIRLHTREGFQNADTAAPVNQTPMERWSTLSEQFALPALCSLCTDVQTKMRGYEKGAPPDELTEDQAREKVDKIFADKMTGPLFSCIKFEELKEAKDIDTFFVKIQEMPNDFLVRAYDTARALQSILRGQLIEIEKSLNKDVGESSYPEEPFVNPSVGICSPDVVEERRKFLRQKRLTEQQQSCLLPEEVPLDHKEQIANAKITTLVNTIGMDMASKIPAIVKQATGFRDKMEQYKNEAEKGTLKPSTETPDVFSREED